ncbi:MAG: short chain dehydrogenase [Chlamydiia bacterium]|nr:short chain dehydrogenase [Chlamydiia bacterium]
MKVIIIGGTGTIGAAVAGELSSRHEVLIASRTRGDIICDIASEESIRHLFEKAGKFDAVVVTAGDVHFENFSKMTDAKYRIGLNHKLMGQVNVVLIGREYIQPNGSFTLTSGILSHDPVRAGSSASMVNGAVDSFVKAAAIELTQGIRVNAVSPTLVAESAAAFGSYFYGFEAIPVQQIALSYVKSVEGLQTGQIYQAGY